MMVVNRAVVDGRNVNNFSKDLEIFGIITL
jgi:hypothetical protein